MKKQINLYLPSCYPKREKATFKQFLMLFGICCVSVLMLSLFFNWNFFNAQQAMQQQKALLIKKKNELSGLNTQLQNKKVPEIKVRLQLALQNEITVKKQLLASLAGVELGDELHFSQLMRGLSLAKTDSISITRFSIVGGLLNISGQAKRSDSVPLWLNKIQATKELSGIAFAKLDIVNSDDNNGFFFQLSNDLKTKMNKRAMQ